MYFGSRFQILVHTGGLHHFWDSAEDVHQGEGCGGARLLTSQQQRSRKSQGERQEPSLAPQNVAPVTSPVRPHILTFPKELSPARDQAFNT